MVPTKIPDVEVQPRNKLLASIIVLLILSMMLNVSLWRDLTAQGEKIYKEVVGLIPEVPDQ